VNFTTKVDDKVWAYNAITRELRVVYDWRTNANPVLRGVDNLTARNGSLFVCEDRGPIGFSDDPKACLVAPNGQVSAFLRLYGQRTSELTGAAFNPVATGCMSRRNGAPTAAASPTRSAAPSDDASVPEQAARRPGAGAGRSTRPALGAVGADREAQRGVDAEPTERLGLPAS
jgi:hypothetical protein